jgi:hypothetical protein
MSQSGTDRGKLKRAVRALNALTVAIYLFAAFQLFGHATAQPRPTAARGAVSVAAR